MDLRENFKFPETFVFMDQSGWLDSKNNDVMTSNSYLWLNEMEWLNCKKIINYKYEDEADNIIPFAHTGAGDKWAWYLGDKTNLPVIFCPHDDDEGVIYAKDLKSAIFRQILEFASECNFYNNENNIII